MFLDKGIWFSLGFLSFYFSSYFSRIASQAPARRRQEKRGIVARQIVSIRARLSAVTASLLCLLRKLGIIQAVSHAQIDILGLGVQMSKDHQLDDQRIRQT